MPYVLLRHVPVRGRRARCWLAKVPELPVDLNLLSADYRTHVPASQIVIENSYEHLSQVQIQNVIDIAKSRRDLWWPVFMVAAKLLLTYEFVPEFKVPSDFSEKSGGESFMDKVSRRNLVRFTRVKDMKCKVDIIEVDEANFKRAVEDIVDNQDFTILQLFSDPDRNKSEQESVEWADQVEPEIQRQLNEGVQWEMAIRAVQVNDSTSFRRADLC